jgi:hypothetical protein
MHLRIVTGRQNQRADDSYGIWHKRGASTYLKIFKSGKLEEISRLVEHILDGRVLS